MSIDVVPAAVPLALAPPVPQPAHALAATVEHILAAPAAGPLELVVSRPAPLQRQVLTTGALDPVVGLVGDTWAVRHCPRTADGSPHPGMQLTLMSSRVADAITGGDRAAWPWAGDQLYVDMDLSEAALPAGAQLHVGPDAVVEVSGVPHTGCALFLGRFGADAMRFVNAGPGRPGRWRGVNVRVVRGGAIAIGDAVRPA